MERKDGDQWPISLKDPCTICECKQGVVKCQRKACDCSNSNIDPFCCPECQNNGKVCYHQENHNVYRNGQRWTYECETCECIVNIIID